MLIVLAVAFASSLILVMLISSTDTLDSQEKITVYLCAAAKKAWEQLVREFERRTGIKVEAVYGSSGRLLAAIELSGRGDVYAPASPEYMAMALKRGIIDPKSIRIAAYIVPAIIVPRSNPANITGLGDLAKPGVKVAIGDPEHVVIGQYAVEILEYNGLWEQVRKNIVVYAENAAKLAALVAMGVVDAVINWHVTHYWYSNSTEIIWLKPSELPRISYIPIAVLSTSRNREAALEFVKFVTSSDYAKHVWQRYHYITTLDEVVKAAPEAEIPGIRELLDDSKVIANRTNSS